MFWRVELDKEGSIKSCDHVPEQGKNGGRVIYVEAETKANACSAAKAWYERHRARKTGQAERRVARSRAAGLCTSCGTAPHRENRNTCLGCAERRDRLRRETRAGLRAPRENMTPSESKEAFLGRQARNKAKRGLFHCHSSVLLNRARELGDSGPLVQWLIAEQERRAAAWRAANPEPEPEPLQQAAE